MDLSHWSLLKNTERCLIRLNFLVIVVDLAIPKLINHLICLAFVK